MEETSQSVHRVWMCARRQCGASKIQITYDVFHIKMLDVCGASMSGADLSARGAVQRGCRRDALCGEAARDSCGEAPPWHLHATRSQYPEVRSKHIYVIDAVYISSREDMAQIVQTPSTPLHVSFGARETLVVHCSVCTVGMGGWASGPAT